MPAKKSSGVLLPNLGLYLDRPALAIPTRGLLDGLNFRVRDGTLTNRLLGWSRFSDFTLNGPVRLISNFLKADGTDELIFGTLTDLYRYDAVGDDVEYITPQYDTGTAAASGTAVTGTGTTWSTNAVAGDQIHFGDANYVDPAGTWYTIQSVGGDTSITLTATAGTVADGAYTIRRLFTGDIFNHWDSAVFLNASPDSADVWFGTNGVDYVVKWNPTNPTAEYQSALGFTAKHLAVYNNMMIYANLNQASVDLPTSIINSHTGEPVNVTSGLSEQFVIHSGPEEIVDMQTLGDNLVIYSEKRHVTLAQFVGDPLVFAFRQAVDGTGPVGTSYVANFGDYHEFIGNDSQYRFDGASLQPIGTQVWKVLLRSRDPTRTELGFHHFDEESGDLIWAMPLVTDTGADANDETPNEVAFPEHYLEEVGPQDPTPVSKREFPFTSAGNYTQQGSGDTWTTVTDTWDALSFRWNEQFFFAAFPLNLVGNADGEVYSLNTSDTADGTPLDAYIHFGRRVLGDARMRGLLARVYPFVSNPSGEDFDLDVTLYLSDHASGSATATDPFPFDMTLPQGGHFVSTFRRGRFFEARFGTEGIAEPWIFEGYDIDAKYGGQR